MYKQFMELEKRACENKVFVDYEVITATPGYAAVQCTVSDENGKRIVRMASEKTLEAAFEKCGLAALCAFFNEEAVTPDEKSPTQDSVPVIHDEQKKEPQMVNLEGAKQDKPTKQSPKTTSDTSKQTDKKNDKNSAVNATQPSEKERQPATDNKQSRTEKNQAGNIPANTTPETHTNTSASAPETKTEMSTEMAADDFRVDMGAYKTREDNYISQLLKTPDGQDYIKKVLRIKNPSGSIVERVNKIKEYVKKHNIILE